MAVFCKPFTTAKLRYFDVSETTQAEAWIHEGLTVAQTPAPGAGSGQQP